MGLWRNNSAEEEDALVVVNEEVQTDPANNVEQTNKVINEGEETDKLNAEGLDEINALSTSKRPNHVIRAPIKTVNDTYDDFDDVVSSESDDNSEDRRHLTIKSRIKKKAIMVKRYIFNRITLIKFQ